MEQCSLSFYEKYINAYYQIADNLIYLKIKLVGSQKLLRTVKNCFALCFSFIGVTYIIFVMTNTFSLILKHSCPLEKK